MYLCFVLILYKWVYTAIDSIASNTFRYLYRLNGVFSYLVVSMCVFVYFSNVYSYLFDFPPLIYEYILYRTIVHYRFTGGRNKITISNYYWNLGGMETNLKNRNIHWCAMLFVLASYHLQHRRWLAVSFKGGGARLIVWNLWEIWDSVETLCYRILISCKIYANIKQIQ